MDTNQASLNPEKRIPTIAVAEASWEIHSLEPTNLSSFNLLEQTNPTTPATQVPCRVVTMIYTSIPPRQSEETEATMPSSGKSLVVRSEEDWETYPVIQDSRYSLHRDEPQASGQPQPPLKNSFDSLAPLTIGDEVQVGYEKEYSTIAVPQLPVENSTISPGPMTIGEEIELEYEQEYSSIAVPQLLAEDTTVGPGPLTKVGEEAQIEYEQRYSTIPASQLQTESSTASPGPLIIGNIVQIQHDQEHSTIAVPQLQVNNSTADPGTLTIGKEVQLEQEYPTIAVPLITDPNSTPELVTFRPGVYEGDAIPPVYSNFSIIATSDDYETPVSVPIQQNMSIFPVLISENHPMTDRIEDPINQKQWTESYSNANTIDVEGSQVLPQAGMAMVEQNQLMTTATCSMSGGRSIDAKTLVTLREKRLILIYKGYHFSRYYCKGLKIRWQCVNPRCDAYLYSVANKITVTHPVHNHLGIICQNLSVQSCAAEPNTVYSLEEAISAMTDPVSSFDQGTDPNSLRAAETDTMTLSYDRDSQITSIETTNQTMTSSDINASSNYETSVGQDVLAAANTFIAHDPSLEITVKSTSVSEEMANNDVVISPSTTITSLPNPMAFCVASYDPNLPNDYGITSDAILNPNSNYMSVPKDVGVKVTLTSIPKICEPQVYYDGKLAQSSLKRKMSTSKPKRETARDLVSPHAPSAITLKTPKVTIASTKTDVLVSKTTATNDSTAMRASTLTYYTASDPTKAKKDIVKPNINILRSQIVSGSDPQYSNLFNALTPRAQILAPNPQVRCEVPANITQGNCSVSDFSTPTSITLRNFRQNSPNIVLGQLAQNTAIHETSSNSNYPFTIQRFRIPRVTMPRISIPADEQVNYSNRRTTRASTRARNTQSREQNQ